MSDDAMVEESPDFKAVDNLMNLRNAKSKKKRRIILESDDSEDGSNAKHNSMFESTSKPYMKAKSKDGIRLWYNADPRLANALGIEVWKELVVNGKDGIQTVTVEGEQVIRSSLKQGRITCAALFTKTEYEDMICDAHVHCRCPDKKSLGKDGEPRYWFSCKFCNETFHDKNSLSHHRIKGCPKYHDNIPLKIYPTFEKSDRATVNTILAKHGLVWPPEEDKPRGKKRKVKVATVVKHLQKHSKAKKAGKEHGPPQQKKANFASTHGETLKQPSSSMGKEPLGQPTSTAMGKESMKETCRNDVSKQDNMTKEVIMEYDPPKQRKAIMTSSPGQRLSQPSGKQPLEQPTSTAMHKETIRELTREDVLKEATIHAAAFKVDYDAFLTPPHASVAPGLFYLISESRKPPVSRDLLAQPQSCVENLQILESEGRLKYMIEDAVGSWLVSAPPMGCISVSRTDDLERLVIRSTAPWRYEVASEDDKLQRYGEIKKLRLHLECEEKRILYESIVQERQKALAEKQSTYIAEQLKLFDNQQLMKQEEVEWGWCPLFSVLVRAAAVNGMPERPWMHTPGEWDEIATALETKINTEPDTLELECPHIIRALKLYARLCSGKFSPISHPFDGMTRANLLAIAQDQFESVRLTVCTHDVFDCGWFLFPSMTSSNEPINKGRRDLLGLLGYDDYHQDVVLAKIEEFMTRVALRAIVDMIRLGKIEALACMWYASKDPSLERQKCDQILRERMVIREDLDFGWALLGLEEKQPSPILQPHVDAVVKAMNNMRRAQVSITLKDLRVKPKSVSLEEGSSAFKQGLLAEEAGQQLCIGVDQYGSVVEEQLPQVGMTSHWGTSSIEGTQNLCTPTVASLNGLELHCSQLVSSDTFKMDWMDSLSFGDAESAKERELMGLHKSHPPAPISRGLNGAFSRTPHTCSPSLAPNRQCVSPIRKLQLPQSLASPTHSLSHGQSVSVSEIVREYLISHEVDEGDRIAFDLGKASTHLSVADMELLEDDEGKLSSHTMAWFVMWYNHKIDDPNIYICLPYLARNLKTLILKKGSSLNVIRSYVEGKKGLTSVKATVFVVPILDCGHWSVAVLSSEGHLKFDSMNNGNYHGTNRLHECLGKMYGLIHGYRQGDSQWKKVTGMENWRHVQVPQQPDKWTCGWYCIKYIMEYCTRRGDKWLEKMDHIFSHGEAVHTKTIVKTQIIAALNDARSDSSPWKVFVTSVPTRLAHPYKVLSQTDKALASSSKGKTITLSDG